MDMPSNPALRGLSITDRSYALLSGIAVGWIENRQVFRCACLLCGIRVDHPRGERPNEAAYEAVLEFLVEVGKSKCEHWEKYRRMRDDPDFETSEEMLNTRAALQRGRKPRARRDRCQES